MLRAVVVTGWRAAPPVVANGSADCRARGLAAGEVFVSCEAVLDSNGDAMPVCEVVAGRRGEEDFTAAAEVLAGEEVVARGLAD